MSSILSGRSAEASQETRAAQPSARRIAASGAGRSNQSSKASAPWCSNIVRPLAPRAPASAAAASSRVGVFLVEEIVNHQMRRDQRMRQRRGSDCRRPRVVALTTKSVRSSCVRERSILPGNRLQPRFGAEHAWSAKVTGQFARQRLRLVEGAIHEHETLAIFRGALVGEGAARSPTRSEQEDPQIAQIDREFLPNGTLEPGTVGVPA